jgi:hypothetical protein
LVFEGDVAVETVLVGSNPVPIFVDASSVHDEEKRFGIRLISDEIVDDAAGGVSEQGVLTFAWAWARAVVRRSDEWSAMG